MVDIWKKPALFFLGGGSYVLVELLWRGRSHISMFFAGGTCFLLLGGLEGAKPRLPVVFRGIFGAGVITMVELLAGLLVNRQYRVWDYRELPMNFHGQVCLPFCALWIPLSLGAMKLYRHMNRILDRTLAGWYNDPKK